MTLPVHSNSKLILISIGVVFFTVVAGVLFYIPAHQPRQIVFDDRHKASDISLLTVINSQVQTKTLPQDQFTDVDSSAELAEGTKVRTLPTGRAVIEFSNFTTTVVDKNSEFTVVDQAENKTKIQLESGSLWARVRQVFNKGVYYQIETPNAVATVRGTAFGVTYQNNTTVILVLENQVSVLPLNPKTKQPTGGEIIVGENQKTTITSDQKPVIETITALDKKSEWYQFNQKNIATPSSMPEASPSVLPAPSKITTPDFSSEPIPLATLKATPTPSAYSTPSSPSSEQAPSTNSPQVSSTASPTPTPQPELLQGIAPKTVDRDAKY